jgi:hypothetical protein
MSFLDHHRILKVVAETVADVSCFSVFLALKLSDFRSDIPINYHNNLGETVTAPSGFQQVYSNGTLRATSTPRGAIWHAALFANIRHFSDCKFFRVTGTPIATLQITSDLGTIHGFTSLFIAQEYTLSAFKTLAGMSGIGELW